MENPPVYMMPVIIFMSNMKKEEAWTEISAVLGMVGECMLLINIHRITFYTLHAIV